MSERPLETGWLADTPVDDTVLRRFLHNQADVDAGLAEAVGGRAERHDDISLADTGGPVAYLNQAVLLRPLAGADDPVLDVVADFYRPADGRPRTLLSLWPTPDLRARGWQLVGHPGFVVRAPGPVAAAPPPGVAIERATTPDALAVAERIAVEGFPIDEARDLAAGSLLADVADVVVRVASVDGEPAAVGISHVGHGVVNLALGATLPWARRRGVWEALVWARVADAPELPTVAYTSDMSRPGFERMGFLTIVRFTLWAAIGPA